MEILHFIELQLTVEVEDSQVNIAMVRAEVEEVMRVSPVAEVMQYMVLKGAGGIMLEIVQMLEVEVVQVVFVVVIVCVVGE